MSAAAKQRRTLSLAGLLLLLSAFLSLLPLVCFDSDPYFLIATGRYIVEHGIPYTNPFTFLSGLNIIVQQWAWDVIVYVCYTGLGKAGLFLLSAAVAALTLFLLCRLAMLLGMQMRPALFLSGTFALLAVKFFSTRPTGVTIALLIWQVYLLESCRQSGRVRTLLWLIPISILEANLHSALWIMHFIFLLPYLVPPIPNPLAHLEQPRHQKRLPLLCIMPAMAAAGLLNPYGLDGLLYLYYSYGDQLKDAGIVELQPLSLKSFWGVSFLIVLGLVLYQIWCRRKPVRSDYAYLFAGVTLMAATSVRNCPCFLLGAVILLFSLLRDVRAPKLSAFLERQNSLSLRLSSILVFPLTIPFLAYMVQNLNTTPRDSAFAPISAIRCLDEHEAGRKEELRIFTVFNCGAYFEFCGCKSCIDARPELYSQKLNRSGEYFKEYNETIRSSEPEVIQALLDKYQFDYVFAHPDSRMRLYLSLNPSCAPVVETEEYLLYQRLG